MSVKSFCVFSVEMNIPKEKVIKYWEKVQESTFWGYVFFLLREWICLKNQKVLGKVNVIWECKVIQGDGF